MKHSRPVPGAPGSTFYAAASALLLALWHSSSALWLLVLKIVPGSPRLFLASGLEMFSPGSVAHFLGTLGTAVLLACINVLFYVAVARVFAAPDSGKEPGPYDEGGYAGPFVDETRCEKCPSLADVRAPPDYLFDRKVRVCIT